QENIPFFSGINITCFSLKERLFLVRTLWLYLIIMKFLFFCFSLLEELANGLILVFFLTNSFLSVFPAWNRQCNIASEGHFPSPTINITCLMVTGSAAVTTNLRSG
uniref:Uncharacterized protein n=1 Tax=Cyanistes caeruleus TaxID=156563 RepID=A0A8C0VP88_CYACU